MHLLVQSPFSQCSRPEVRIIVALGERIEIDARPRLREFEPSEQIDVLPGDGRDVPEDLEAQGVQKVHLLPSGSIPADTSSLPICSRA